MLTTLAVLRKNMNLTQKQLAKKLNIPLLTVQHMEKGYHPNAKLQEEVAELFGMDFEKLVSRIQI